MFCGECGAKNQTGDAFCCECGSKLVQEDNNEQETEQVVVTESTPKVKKAPTKKSKMKTILIVLLVAILGIGYKVGSEFFGPKKVAQMYIDAVVKNDSDKLYSYLELEGDKTFVSKKIYKKLIKDSKQDSSKIVNFKITDIEYGNGKITAKVKYTYTTKDSSGEKVGYLNLTKQKEKKYFIFDSWKIDSMKESNIVVKNYTIKVNKDSEVKYDGVKLKDKYLDKEQSTSSQDVYVLPQVFTTYQHTINTKLASGLELEEQVKASSYSNIHTVKFSSDSMSQTMKDKLITKAKENLTTIYSSAIDKKEFSEIKSSFEHEGVDISNLETSYDNLVSNLSSAYNKLTSITFKEGTLYSVNLNEDGNLELRISFKYDYNIKYTNYSDKEETHSGNSYNTITVTFTYDKGEYYLVNCSNLVTYFSRY